MSISNAFDNLAEPDDTEIIALLEHISLYTGL
jgi:hypothetical protein